MHTPPSMPTFTPRTLIRAQVALESFCVAPGGESVVYALRRVVGNDYHSHLSMRPWRGGRARQLTRGAVRDASPAISPDGTRLAFLRSPVGAKEEQPGQVWLMALDGGEAWRLTKLKHGVGALSWSPDGRRLAIVAQAGDHRFIVGRESKDRTPVARRITRLDFRDDESGHVVRRSHLWVLEARAGSRPRQLTRGDFDVTHPAWSPDGKRIAFAADRGTDANIHPRIQIWSVPVGGGRLTELASLAGDADWPAYSPNGSHLAFIGTDVDDPPDHIPPALWVRELPRGSPTPLTAALDRPVGEWAWADLVMAEEAPGPVWLGADEIVVLVGDRGRNLPYRVSLDARATPMADQARHVTGAGLAASLAGDRLALSAGVDGEGADVFAVEASGLRRLTREGASWMRRFPIPRIEEVELPGPAGPIQTWIASPAGSRRRPLPTVLHVHGGPTGAWGGDTMDSLALCDAGYRVVMPNIRGSATLGATWVEALFARWGDADAEDAMAVMDAVIERRLADQDRLFVMGLSYGGFLTQWLVGMTDRFAAAAAENGVANQISTWANSYFGIHYDRRAGLGDPLSDRGQASLWRSSPLRNASRITTPLLILQAEEDRICPASDNEQLFAALKVLGRETELILYPDEHHEMKSYGRPDRRVDRMERILDWFARHPRRRAANAS